MASLSQFLIVIHWAVRGDYKTKWKRLREKPAVWIFVLLFLWHVVGMIYTDDFNYGWHDLKIKVPLLLLPIVLASSEMLKGREVKLVLLFFVAAVIASSLVTLAGIFDLLNLQITDFREASLFISHIRFALLVDLALFILSFFALRSKAKVYERFLYFGAVSYLIVFLIMSKALTGLVVGLIVGLVLAFRWVMTHSDQMLRWFALVAILTIPVLVSSYIGSKFNKFYTVKDDLEHLDKLTILGNPYWHDTTNLFLENGHYVGLYQCDKELDSAWNLRSEIPIDAYDAKGNEIKYTLKRYLTSRGLRKDAYSVSKLSEEDIDLIESGFANEIYKNRNRFYTRMYELIWQIDVYKKGGNPSGHSVTQRFEYLKTGWSIFRDHIWFGVGTGDVAEAFASKYKEMNTRLDPKWQLRAHNQWLTFAIALGSIGFVISLLSFFMPAIISRRFSNYFFLLFFMIAFISMFNEDTLETQAGVAFIAFFYPLFLFVIPDETSFE